MAGGGVGGLGYRVGYELARVVEKTCSERKRALGASVVFDVCVYTEGDGFGLRAVFVTPLRELDKRIALARERIVPVPV